MAERIVRVHVAGSVAFERNLNGDDTVELFSEGDGDVEIYIRSEGTPREVPPGFTSEQEDKDG